MRTEVRAALLALAALPLGDAARIRHELAAAASRERKPKAPKLCDPEIVAETCEEAFNLKADTDKLTRKDVQDILSATADSVDALWRMSKMPDEVRCRRLCREVVDALRSPPPSSDVGCYMLAGQQRCDLDLSPKSIKSHFQKKGDMPDFHDKDKMAALLQAANRTKAQRPERPRRGGKDNKGKDAGDKDDDDDDDENRAKVVHEEPKEIQYRTKELVRRIANLFRIYPATLTTVGEAATEEEEHAAEDVSVQLEMGSQGDDGDDDDDSTEGADDVADNAQGEGSLAEADAESGVTWGRRRRSRRRTPPPAPPTPRPTPRPTPAPTPAPVQCRQDSTTYRDPVFGESCKDWSGYECNTMEFAKELLWNCPKACGVDPCCRDSATYRDPKYGRMCSQWAQYDCSAPTFSDALMENCPVSCKACGSTLKEVPLPAPAPSMVEPWKQELAKVNAMAIAYINTALRKFNARQTQRHMDIWYGPRAFNDMSLRAKIKRVLNGVDAMLGNVEFVMGPQCKTNTYAYVYPEAYTCSPSQLTTEPCTKNTKDQFIFYICDLTLKSKVAVQIETLTHEGSHHATGFTDDVDFQGETAYGRQRCKMLAQENPELAVKNADNFCYYVQDITDEP